MKVYCESCQQWIDEEGIKIDNIEEDVYGRDIVTFCCPYCKSNQKSIRRM
jgi:Zn finger protein HypA/HybF involved in hydrogenase expression